MWAEDVMPGMERPHNRDCLPWKAFGGDLFLGLSSLLVARPWLYRSSSAAGCDAFCHAVVDLRLCGSANAYASRASGSS